MFPARSDGQKVGVPGFCCNEQRVRNVVNTLSEIDDLGLEREVFALQLGNSGCSVANDLGACNAGRRMSMVPGERTCARLEQRSRDGQLHLTERKSART